MTRLKAALNLIKRGNIFFCNNHEVSEIVVQWPYQFVKVRQSRNGFFFQSEVSSKKQMNEFDFTTMKPQVDLLSFVLFFERN